MNAFVQIIVSARIISIHMLTSKNHTGSNLVNKEATNPVYYSLTGNTLSKACNCLWCEVMHCLSEEIVIR